MRRATICYYVANRMIEKGPFSIPEEAVPKLLISHFNFKLASHLSKIGFIYNKKEYGI